MIWRSPLIPSDPLVWRADLDDDAKNRLYRFIMSYGRSGTPEQVAAAREVLGALQWAPFRPSSNAQLYPIRVLALSKEINQLRADDRLDAAERDAKIAELEASKAEIEALMETLGAPEARS